jgi:hypothetical protein
LLNVTKRDPASRAAVIEGVTQRVRYDPLADSGTASDTAHDPPSSMPVDPFAVGSEEDRAFHTFPDGQVNSAGDAGSEWRRHQLAARAQHRQRAMPALHTEGSMCAPSASDTRNPFNANSETNAWSRGDDNRR